MPNDKSQMTNSARGVLLTACCVLLVSPAFSGEQGIDPAAVPRLTAATEPPAPEKFAHAEGLLDPAALAQSIESSKLKTVLIDARDPSAFKLGHLPAARN